MQWGIGIKCLAIGAFFALSACVLPVGPQFEDEPNYAPFIESSSPLTGQRVQGPPLASPMFSVTIGDPNVHDQLFVRWLYDYPTYDEAISRQPEGTTAVAPNGQVIREPLEPFVPGCRRQEIARGFTQHRLVLVVSDRPFLDPDRDSVDPMLRYDSVPPGAHRVQGVWFLEMECRE